MKTKNQLLMIIQGARLAGLTAGRKKLTELVEAGPKYNVLSGEQVVGQMLDCCGFARCIIPGLNRRSKAVRELIDQGYLDFDSYLKRVYLRGEQTMRQEISVNEASSQAAADYFKENGIEAYVDSRLD